MRMKLRTINTTTHADQPVSAKTHTLSFSAVTVGAAAPMSMSTLTLHLTAEEAAGYELGKDYFVTAAVAPELPLDTGTTESEPISSYLK